MTAKEYLNQAYKIDRRIKINNAKILKMRECLDYKGQAENTGTSHGSATADGMPDTVCAIIDYEQRVQALTDALTKLYLEIENAIQSISDPVQREVLERRYLLYQAWESHYDRISGEYIKGIAEDMRYSARQIFRIHGEALRNVSVNVSECQLKK